MMNRSNVWNYWIIYPAIFWVPITAADALLVYRPSQSPKARSRAGSAAKPDSRTDRMPLWRIGNSGPGPTGVNWPGAVNGRRVR
jgi:hypothetical protein